MLGNNFFENINQACKVDFVKNLKNALLALLMPETYNHLVVKADGMEFDGKSLKLDPKARFVEEVWEDICKQPEFGHCINYDHKSGKSYYTVWALPYKKPNV